MGSFFAGVKAGTLGGILYVGGIAVFNIFMLYALKSSFLVAINQIAPIQCPLHPTVNGSAEDCFDSQLAVYVPFSAFVGFFVALVWAGIFGLYYDTLPSHGSFVRGLIFAAIIGFNLLLFNLSGYVFDTTSETATLIMMILWTPTFGYILGRLYMRYTKAVEISSQDSNLLRVVIDGRDSTGKVKTFATTSNHRLRADLAEDASFKEWEATGGVLLEDTRSFETTMEINENGKIVGKVGPKY